MGQIVGAKAKPKRANLNALSQVGTPALGEHVLVSSDNSMSADGQGNFDCYIVGDGNTAATALPLNSIASETIQPTRNGVSGMAFFRPLIETIQPTRVNGYFYNLLTRQLVSNSLYWYCIQEIPEMASKLKTRWEKSTGGGIGIEFRDSNGNVVGTFSNLTQDEGSMIEIDIPSSATVFTYSYKSRLTFDGFEFTILKSILDIDADFSYSSEKPIQNKMITETLFGEPFFELTGFGTDGTVAGVTQVGEVYYNTNSKLLRKCVVVGEQFETISFNGGIYKNRQNGLFYKWNGTDMVETPRNGGINGKIADVEEKVEIISKSSTQTIQPTRVNGYFYNLLTRQLVSNKLYWYCIQEIPEMASKLKTRWEKSTGGGIGIEFRDSNGNVVGTFSNLTQDEGSMIEIDIPSSATVFTYSYKSRQTFDGFEFTLISIIKRIEELEDSQDKISAAEKLPVYGGAQLYLSAATPNDAQDDYTLAQLYAGYDELCNNHPQWIERIDDIGTDSDENEIRQYRIGYKSPLIVNGEANIIKSESATPTNLFTEAMRYKKILVNTGTHGDEKAPCWATMLAVKELVESSEPWAMFIKTSFNIYVCPTLNPYGFQNRTLANANGVNINRDIAAQTQPESQAWKEWVDANNDAIAYLDMHGVDYFYPFIEYAPNASDDNMKLYTEIATQFAGAFKENWDNVYGERNFPRPYVVKSTYNGMTINYTESLGIKGFIVETPNDIVSNQLKPAPNYGTSYGKSNKMTKDLLINIIQYFGCYKLLE